MTNDFVELIEGCRIEVCSGKLLNQKRAFIKIIVLTYWKAKNEFTVHGKTKDGSLIAGTYFQSKKNAVDYFKDEVDFITDITEEGQKKILNQ